MILICYLEYVTPSDFPLVFRVGAQSFWFSFFLCPFCILQIPLDLPTALPNLQQWQFAASKQSIQMNSLSQ